MKPLLTRIEEELAVCTDPYRRAELLGEKGCYLARVGEFESAREVVADLRSDVRLATTGRVAVRIMVLEGLLLFFEHLDAGYRDRMLRAHAISQAAGYADLARLAAAWVAHADLSMDSFANACRMLACALDASAPLDDEATIRAHLVFADFSMLAGRIDLGKKAYEIARRGAVARGDDSSIAACFYNRANFLLNHERVCAATGRKTGESRRNLEIEIRSVNLYHQGSGQTSLSHLLHSMNAMVHFLGEQFDEAAALYRLLLTTGRALNVGADQAIQFMEYAICLFSIGQAEEARKILAQLAGMPTGQRLFDDTVIIASLKTRLASQFGVAIDFVEGEHDVQAAVARYQIAVDELSIMLDPLSLQIDMH